MLHWLNGRVGSDEQRRVASKVRYAIFVGDLVEGVGVYPNQERDLAITDVYKQYDYFEQYLKQIPSNIQIILVPGNHDIGRLSEPQPSLFFDTMKSISQMPNVLSLSNPCIFNIGSHKDIDFPGFDVLLYHGGSIFYYAENLPLVRSQGGIKRTDLVMKYLLQRRHLAPTHSSTIYVPDSQKDPLVIETVPDFFVTGHTHKLAVSSYRNVTIINASCWAGMTDYMEKRGVVPEPGRLPIVNLQTREVKVMNFLSREALEKEERDKTRQENKGENPLLAQDKGDGM
jgi:DNA polymerase II small subunit